MSLDMTFVDGERRFRFRLRPLLVPPAADGLFDDTAVIRRVYSDAVCGLGAGNALLLQLAHPSIAAGVEEHSDYRQRPLDRLFGTLFATNAVVFGSRADAEAVRVAMRAVHSRVTGPGYRALDPELLCWVNATLLGTAAGLYQRIIHPLSGPELDELVRDSRLVGAIFGCPEAAQPASWDEFRVYWDATIESLSVSETARRVAGSLLAGRGLPLRSLWRPPLIVARAVTAATLPPRIRVDYGLPWSGPDRMLAAAALRSAGAVMPRLPDRWRRLGPELLRSPATGPAGGAAAA